MGHVGAGGSMALLTWKSLKAIQQLAWDWGKVLGASKTFNKTSGIQL